MELPDVDGCFEALLILFLVEEIHTWVIERDEALDWQFALI